MKGSVCMKMTWGVRFRRLLSHVRMTCFLNRPQVRRAATGPSWRGARRRLLLECCCRGRTPGAATLQFECMFEFLNVSMFHGIFTCNMHVSMRVKQLCLHPQMTRPPRWRTYDTTTMLVHMTLFTTKSGLHGNTSLEH